MKRKQIQSDSERSRLLTNLVAHSEITNPSGETIFDPETITRFQALIADFTQAITARKESIYARRELRLERDRAQIDLKTEIQILWRTIRGWVRTGKIQPSGYVLHELDAAGNQPGNIRNRGWLTLGEQILEGDSIAEAAGSPSIGEAVRTALAEALKAVRETSLRLERGTTGENKTIQQLAIQRERVHNAIRKVSLTLGLAFADHTPLEQRKAMRILGFTFSGDPEVTDGATEPQIPDETTEPVAEQPA